MNIQELSSTARAIVAKGKGILAADESFPTIAKRFKKINTESTEENRRAYRELLFTTKGAGEFISGVILFDETLRQSASDGRRFVDVLKQQGSIAGIKVDKGAKALANYPGEKITDGLDGLRDRCKEYYDLGARFTKWRAVIAIGDGIPTRFCIDANAHVLARYAALSQEAGLVPIVEPEVLMDGSHTIEVCEHVTVTALESLYFHLKAHKVQFEGTLLKPNMVLPGKECPVQAGIEEVAAMNAMGSFPWELSFSYGRALQAPPLAAWAGKPENVPVAQRAYYKRAKLNGAARYGKYTADMESTA
jgi:fructose-bisphosphate aldolase class I